MQNPVEEFTLLPRNEGQIHRNEDGEYHRTRFKRFIKLPNRTRLYKNLLLWVILFGCFFLLAAPLALHLSYALPSIKPRAIPLFEFSEERARDLYPNLTRHGPRVANTRADYLTRDFLILQINQIRSTARDSIRFEISLQNFSAGDVEHLQNIAVRVSNLNSSMNTSCLMLVAHYDSVEFSPGGSDDGSGVVISLELLSNLVHDPKITFSQVHLIVLFTGGEELGLTGAEVFVKYHPWKNDVRRFINLDSVGGNEKAILFRVKPSQVSFDPHSSVTLKSAFFAKLVNEYRRVPRPHANVIGDEILEHTGSDTDYSIFTNHGLLLGYDFAYYLDGYNYHTSIDKPSIVEEGALQHLGENTLVQSRDILLGEFNLEKPETIFDEEDYIYFDVLGRHLITYKKSTATIIQSILIAFVISIGLLVIILDHIWYQKNASVNDFTSIYFYFQYPLLMRIVSIIIFFLGYLFSMICGIFSAVIIAFIISKFRPLSWYGNSALATFLFGLPCLIGIILCECLCSYIRRVFLFKYPKRNPMEIKAIHHIERLYFHFERHWALLLILAFLMSVAIFLGNRSLYLILLWSIFICPIYLILILFEFICRWLKKKFVSLFNEQGWYWLFAPYIVSLVPLIHTLEMTSRLLRLSIPIMGRLFVPIRLSQDIIICLIVVVPAVLFYLIFIPNIQRVMNYARALILLTISFIIVLLIACLRQPFTRTHPKIIQIEHDSYTFYRLNNPNTFPMTIPIDHHNSTIAIQSYDKLVLSPTLDEISRRTGYRFNRRACSTPTKCSFEDPSNRSMAFKQVELTWMNTSANHYQFTIRHLPSYQIGIAAPPWVYFVVHNATLKPRTETIVDVQLRNSLFAFDFKLRLERCDINDSPFLSSFTEKFSHIVLWGAGRCQTLTDLLHLSFRNYQ